MKTKLEDPLLVAMNIKEGTKSKTNPNHNEHEIYHTIKLQMNENEFHK